MDLVNRFMRYVRINTESAEDAGVTPSTPGQMEFVQRLQTELEAMGLEEITEVNMDTIPTTLKHANSKFPVLTNGVYPVTQDMKDDLIESVNWALKNPFSLPESN